MSIDEEFVSAQQRVQGLTKRPSDAELLQLYALYKQGTDGDARGKRPGMLDLKGRFKFDAWAKLKGTARGDAKQQYVALVNDLCGRYQ